MQELKKSLAEAIAEIKELIQKRDSVSEQTGRELINQIQKINTTQKTIIEALGWVIVEYDNEAVDDHRQLKKFQNHVVSLENKIKQFTN